MTLTIAYITARRDPKIEWFYDSLQRQANFDDRPSVIVIDLFANSRPKWNEHCAPKPNVWQGEHRLTKADWFAVANARNTALCLCETDYIAYVDDLSVLEPGWLTAVKEAMAGGYCVAGAYMKVKNLVVEDGTVKSFDSHALDSRWDLQQSTIHVCNGGWLYGCSCGFPVGDLLDVGGWPEYCDGMGSEDYCLGIALKNAGKPLMYDKRMLTLESEEHHHYTFDAAGNKVQHGNDALRRMDKGVSPNDKSHAALNIAKSSTYFPNYFGGGMRALRAHVLVTGQFPVIQSPKHDWFDGQLISEME